MGLAFAPILLPMVIEIEKARAKSPDWVRKRWWVEITGVSFLGSVVLLCSMFSEVCGFCHGAL